MKFKEYLLEITKQKWSDEKVANALMKGIKVDKENSVLFYDIAMNLRNYNQTDTFGRIYLHNGIKTLMDELWYRTASSYEKSKQYDANLIKKLKKNFYKLEKTLFKGYKKVDNYFTEE